MGYIEQKSRKRQRRTNLKKIILGSVATAGVIGIATITPNVLGAMSKLGFIPNKRQSESINRSRNRLIKQGLLKYKDGYVQITQKGERELRLMEAKMYAIKKPHRWDGKWRMLIFDIPEKRQRIRARVREILSLIGFVRLQHSVWIYPYDCEDTVTLLKTDLMIGKEMLYLIVDSIENDKTYRKHFGLQ